MTAPAVPRVTKAPAPRPVASLDDILLELVDIDDNVRDDVGELTELQASIAELGLLSPVKVTSQSDGRYRLVYGQRRVLACRALGRLRISAIVEPPSDVDHAGARRSIEQLAENLQRKDLNPIEEAVALREVLDADPNLTQEALADQLAMSRPWVSNTLRLLKVDPEVQAKVRAGEISASHATAIAALPAKQQRDLAIRVVSQKMSAHDLEREIKWKQDATLQDENKRKRTERITPKVVAMLEKAATPKSAALLVHGPWDVDVDAVVTAVKRAGWKDARNQYGYGNRPDRCDCDAFRVEISGRSPNLQAACIDKGHQDMARDVDQSADRARRKALAERVDELRTRVRAALDLVPVPLLLLAHGDTWALPKLVENAPATDPSELRDMVADAMVDRADASRVYTDRQKALETALEALIAMLEPAPAKKSRKAAAAG